MTETINSDFIVNGIFLARPPCAKTGCENKGFVNVEGLWLCGDCVVSLHKGRQNVVLERLNGSE